MTTVVIALGSNLGDRAWHLRRAIHELREAVRIVRISAIHETEPVDAPPGSPRFLNVVVVGYTALSPRDLLDALLAIEKTVGRPSRRIRNEPRIIDLDLILHGVTRMRTKALTLPHPRAHQREFVMRPMGEVWGRPGAVYP